MTPFVEAAQEAFSPVLDSHGFTVDAVADDTWYAKVEWERAGIRPQGQRRPARQPD